MAKSVLPGSFENGFRVSWARVHLGLLGPNNLSMMMISLTGSEKLSSSVHNSVGLNTVQSWPTIYDATSFPHGLPKWWKPSSEVDVLICRGMKFSDFFSGACFLTCR